MMIGEHHRMSHSVVVKLFHSCAQFPRNVRLSHRQIATFSAHRDFFDNCALQILLLTYTLTQEFLVGNI